MKRYWAVRVVQPEETDDRRPNNDLPGLWVEQLRHLGVLRDLTPFSDSDKHTVFEFQFPGNTRGADTRRWAEMESQRMRSFGINAVAAPVWNHGDAV